MRRKGGTGDLEDRRHNRAEGDPQRRFPCQKFFPCILSLLRQRGRVVHHGKAADGGETELRGGPKSPCCCHHPREGGPGKRGAQGSEGC